MGLNRIRLLYIGDATLARECLGRPGGSIEVVESVPAPGTKVDPSSYDVVFVEHPCPGVDSAAIFKDISARKLNVPLVLVAEWNEKLAVAALKLGATDYVVKSAPSFRAVYFRLNRFLAQAAEAIELAENRQRLSQSNESLARTAQQLAERERQLVERDSRIAESERRLAEGKDRLAENENRLTQTTSALERVEATLRETEEQHNSRIAAALAALETAEQQAVAERQAASSRLAEVTAELERARQDAEAERQITSHKIVQLVAKTEAARQEAGERHLQLGALERKLADGAAALERASEQHAREMGDATTRHAEMVRKLAETAATLARAQEDAATEREAAAEKFERLSASAEADRHAAAERGRTLEEQVARTTAEFESVTTRFEQVQRELEDTAATLARTQQEAAADRQAAADRERSLEEQLARTTAEFESVTTRFEQAQRELADTSATLARTQQDGAAERQAARDRQERTDHELAHVTTNRDVLAHQLADVTAALEAARQQAEVERDEATTLYDKIVGELSQETTNRQGLEQRLNETTASLARMTSETAEVQQNLSRETSDREALAQKLGELEQKLGETVAALEQATQRVKEQQTAIERLERDSRLRFARGPATGGRCRANGANTQVNGALARLLGYESAEEMQSVDFAVDVLESGDELRRLAGKCAQSRSVETIETTLRRKDGMRIIAQISAVEVVDDSIDFTVTDITPIRVLEERVRNSQRMEAVARYGSEVAATCTNLLSHVKEEGQQWLGRINSDSARHQGELLLDDVTRAEGFLRQLEAYGQQQKSVPERVDVKEVLRDLEPVLQRVAGGDVKLILPKSAAPLNLDMDGERVERMLVNIAAFGRDRMQDGQLTIKVSAVDLDRAFVAKYPSVQPGPHVLIAVSKIGTPPNGRALSPNPGIDLGALQALVSECGGHLWMMTEPPGDMILKIHLPRKPLSFVAAPASWMRQAIGARH